MSLQMLMFFLLTDIEGNEMFVCLFQRAVLMSTPETNEAAPPARTQLHFALFNYLDQLLRLSFLINLRINTS